MSGLVERVARAICKAQTQSEDMAEAFIPEARAAIAAMLKPNDDGSRYVLATFNKEPVPPPDLTEY